MQTQQDIAVPLSPTGQYRADVSAAYAVIGDLVILRR